MSMLQLNFDKYLAEAGFKPSIYQKRIFEWIENGEGSSVVNAVPGSGKTTTLVEGSKYVSGDIKSQFLAFNKHIVEELKNRLPKYMSCSTIHSLGMASVKKRFPKSKVNGLKYNQIISQYLIDKNVVGKEAKEDRDNLIELIKLVKLTLTDYMNRNQLIELINHFDIDIKGGNWSFWQQAVYDVLEIGISTAKEVIDFDDMVWLPNALDLSIPHLDFLFVDEAQDLNQAQLQLVLKAHHSGTRSLFVGDKFQSIFGFAGADIYSIDNIIQQTNAIQLPLSISYRLPKSHVELANRIYPVIEAADNAIEGVIERGKYDDIPDAVEANDLVVCRCFYPLVPLYFALLKLGKPAQIKNHDVSKQLTKLLKSIFGEGRFDEPLTRSNFIQNVDHYFRLKRIELLEQEENIKLIALEDRIETLKAIYEGGKCRCVSDCIYVINELSQPKFGKPVNLTTIHGAKGLEANRVFIARCDLMPHKHAIKDWEKEQETNLFFVAITRAKSALYLC